MPLSAHLPRDAEWEWLLMLASHPLRLLDAQSRVVDSASSCVIGQNGSRVLLTVAHAVGNEGRWAMELDVDDAQGTRLYELGTMNFLAQVEGSDVMRVDLGYVGVPEMAAQHLVYGGLQLLRREDRFVLSSDLTACPQPGVRYGFSGQVKVGRFDPLAQLHADVEVETGLSFDREEGGFDLYAFDHDHPGDDQYRGCSGAPIIGQDGELVGLVCGRGTGDRIRGLPLRRYRQPIIELMDAIAEERA